MERVSEDNGEIPELPGIRLRKRSSMRTRAAGQNFSSLLGKTRAVDDPGLKSDWLRKTKTSRE